MRLLLALVLLLAVEVTLSRGAVTRRTRGALKKFKLTTLDQSGRRMRQRLTARR